MTNQTIDHGNAPAKQHQDEPIMLTAVAQLVDDGDGGLEASWLLEGDTAELMAGMLLLVADNAPGLCEEDGSAEVFLHADADEVDRLRRALDSEEADCKRFQDSYTALWQEREILRAQLAGQDALLRDIQASHGVLLMTDPPQDPWKVRRISERISAALSASTKASESVARSDVGQGAGDVHRYKAVQLISEAGGRIGYDPHGPDVVLAAAYDELRAQLTELKNTHNRGIAALDTLADRLRAHNDQMGSGVTG